MSNVILAWIVVIGFGVSLWRIGFDHGYRRGLEDGVVAMSVELTRAPRPGGR